MRKLVEEVMKGHDSAREAKVKLQLMKQKIGNNQMARMFVLNYSVLVVWLVQQVERESQELMTRALEEVCTSMRSVYTIAVA